MQSKHPWEIWYAPISFIEDNGKFKSRPTVILGKGEDTLCLVLSVTSKQKPEPFGYLIKHPIQAGLREGSTVLLHEIRSIEESKFQSYVGKLHYEDISCIQRLLTHINGR